MGLQGGTGSGFEVRYPDGWMILGGSDSAEMRYGAPALFWLALPRAKFACIARHSIPGIRSSVMCSRCIEVGPKRPADDFAWFGRCRSYYC